MFVALPVAGTTAADISAIEYRSAVCKAAIASTFNRSYHSMNTEDLSDGIVRVSYRRPSDNTLWINDCRLADNRVIWAGVDVDGQGSGRSRWRKHPLDEQITFEFKDRVIEITHRFDGGSRRMTRVDLDEDVSQ
jgi:hypothetical protein